MLARITIALLLAAGCSSTAKPNQPPGHGSDGSDGSGASSGSNAGSGYGSGSDDQTQGPQPTGKIGQACGAADACLEGACVKYYGIAGPRGPEFKSCEVKCDPGTACPTGKKCITIADGPGMVCR